MITGAGKLTINKKGVGILFIPRPIVHQLELINKDEVKIESKDKKLVITPVIHSY